MDGLLVGGGAGREQMKAVPLSSSVMFAICFRSDPEPSRPDRRFSVLRECEEA